MKNKTKTAWMIIFVASLSLIFSACGNNDFEDAGEAIDDTFEEAGDEIEDATE